MRLHDLQPSEGSHRDRKRLGRGNASGQGTTGGKGTKGQKARAGGQKAGFRGMSSRNFRLAKRRGFSNARHTVRYDVVNLEKLVRFESGATIDLDQLTRVGLIDGRNSNVKILGDGEIAVPLNLVNVKVSAAARDKIEAAGGSVRQDTPALLMEEKTDA